MTKGQQERDNLGKNTSSRIRPGFYSTGFIDEAQKTRFTLKWILRHPGRGIRLIANQPKKSICFIARQPRKFLFGINILQQSLKESSLALEEKMRNLREQTDKNIEYLKESSVVQRSDLVALKNKYELVDSMEETLNQMADIIAHQNSVIDALEDRINHKIGGATSRELVMTNTKNGVFIGKPGDLISDSIRNGGPWDSHVLDLARQVALSRNGLAVDVGAHLGSSTLAFASVFDQVISFEPNDFNFRILRANVLLNGLENVKVSNHGLFSRETVLSLAESSKQEIPIPLDENGELNGDHSSNLGAYYFEERASRLFEHSAITLDSLELDNVVFIKIDVQGADGEVLMGALQTIRRCQPIVVFEWEEQLAMNFTITFRNIQKEFETLGYELSELKKHNEKQIDYVASPLISINNGL